MQESGPFTSLTSAGPDAGDDGGQKEGDINWKSCKKKEAGQQLGKHLDTYWTKGMGKNKQEREKDMNNYNFIIIIFRDTHRSWPMSKPQAFPAENTVPQNREGQNT